MRRLLTDGARILLAWAMTPRAEQDGSLQFSISFPASRTAGRLDGRVLLFISDDGRT